MNKHCQNERRILKNPTTKHEINNTTNRINNKENNNIHENKVYKKQYNRSNDK